MYKILFGLFLFVFISIAGEAYLDSLTTRKVTVKNLATDKVLHNRISDSSICTTGIKYDYLTHYTTFPYYVQFDSSTHGIIGINTADGYDNKYLVLSGASTGAGASRGAWLALAGNEHTIGGNIHMSSGDTGFIVMFTGRGVEFPFYANRDSGKIVLEPHTIGGKSSAIFGCKNDTAGVLMLHSGESITKGLELRHDTIHVKGHLIVDSASSLTSNGYYNAYGYNSYSPTLDETEVMFRSGGNNRFYANGLVDIQGITYVNVSSITGNLAIAAADTIKLDGGYIKASTFTYTNAIDADCTQVNYLTRNGTTNMIEKVTPTATRYPLFGELFDGDNASTHDTLFVRRKGKTWKFLPIEDQ